MSAPAIGSDVSGLVPVCVSLKKLDVSRTWRSVGNTADLRKAGDGECARIVTSIVFHIAELTQTRRSQARIARAPESEQHSEEDE